MAQIYAVLRNRQRIPLSTHTSTVFLREEPYIVADRIERHPRDWYMYLNSLHTVPNWNNYSTLDTLIGSLTDFRVSTVVLSPIQSLGSGSKMLVGVWDLQGFVLV